MHIGVVCEGPTDAHAIRYFLQESLRARGVVPVFVSIQPKIDKTRPSNGGWGLVMNWLTRNPPESRTKAYFRGGLFGEGMSAKQCDVLVIQMDTDILSQVTFQNWMQSNFQYSVNDDPTPIRRGGEVKLILEIVGEFDKLSDDDLSRHVFAPSVESTETWCIAVRRQLEIDPERLRGTDLMREFMTALHESEHRPIQDFVHLNKNADRRHRYCKENSDGFRTLEQQCFHYRALVDSLHVLSHIASQ